MRITRIIAGLYFLLSFEITLAEEFKIEHDLILHESTLNNKVEFYYVRPNTTSPKAILIFLHGHQPEKKQIGGLKLVNDNLLVNYAKEGFIAVAPSMPGYGKTDGSKDWCGPYSQTAIISVIHHLKKKFLNDKIFLIGVSRGALVAGMVATKENHLAGVVLESGFYDLKDIIDERTVNNLKKEVGLDKKSIRERSIITRVKLLTSPVLFLHGYKDPRAPVKSLITFYNELIKHNQNANLVILPAEHHLLADETYEIIKKFINETLVTLNK